MAVDSTAELRDLPPVDTIKIEPFRYERMSKELVDQWSEGIPSFEEANILRPEWQETPLRELSLDREGYGLVWIKDESANPTGTIKDRPAWEFATLYRDFARAIWLKGRRDGQVRPEDFKIPSFSLITAGNEGLAIAERFRQHNLPPPKFIVDLGTAEGIVEELKKLRASIYEVDLKSKSLAAGEILALTDNANGIDITSLQFIEPQAIFYDWHVHEVFNEGPARIYVPRGSGRLMENYLYWQNRTQRNDSSHTPDPRLRVDVASAIAASVIGAEPEEPDSVADKLLARFRPFLIFKDQDISGLKRFAFTGEQTGVYKTREDYINRALQIFQEHKIDAEPSAAVGLALYMQHWDKGVINPKEKVVIVNTGKGLNQEKTEDNLFAKAA